MKYRLIILIMWLSSVISFSQSTGYKFISISYDINHSFYSRKIINEFSKEKISLRDVYSGGNIGIGYIGSKQKILFITNFGTALNFGENDSVSIRERLFMAKMNFMRNVFNSKVFSLYTGVQVGFMTTEFIRSKKTENTFSNFMNSYSFNSLENHSGVIGLNLILFYQKKSDSKVCCFFGLNSCYKIISGRNKFSDFHAQISLGIRRFFE